jgi:hypothetical protein
MKNIGYTLKRYKIWVIAIIIVILAIVSLTKSKTIEDYFLFSKHLIIKSLKKDPQCKGRTYIYG